MHYATHGQTAAEIIFNRVDSNKENIGLTNFKGKTPTREETEFAKNYLTEEELKKAHKEYEKYMQTHLTQAEKDYLEIMNCELKDLEK